jgi:hypothetical protein
MTRCFHRFMSVLEVCNPRQRLRVGRPMLSNTDYDSHKFCTNLKCSNSIHNLCPKSVNILSARPTKLSTHSGRVPKYVPLKSRPFPAQYAVHSEQDRFSRTVASARVDETARAKQMEREANFCSCIVAKQE